VTATWPGEFDPRREVIPAPVELPLASYSLVTIVWPPAIRRTDVRAAARSTRGTVTAAR